MGNEGTPGRPTTRRYSPEEKVRAVRLVRQLRKELGTTRHDPAGRGPDRLRGRVGVESLRTWVKQADIDDGVEPGLTSVEAKWIRELEQENRELRRANDLLKRASAFVAAELDRPSR
jgi:transposase